MNGDQVYDQQGTLYILGSQLGEGGQGKVFAVDSHPRLVIKRFHDSLLQSEDAAPLKRKVEALQQKRIDLTLSGGAWPQFSVCGEGGEWCGYAMRYVKGEPLVPQRFLNPVLLEKK
jgi:DNA-binding helix-hairpin-helix protein with protein kinase domain